MSEAIYISDSDSNEDESNLPSREECEDRCQQFADITGTDTACGMFYLQDRDWSLERALNAYFQENKSSEKSQQSTVSVMEHSGASSRANVTTFPPLLQSTSDKMVRLLSWNIDGLDPDNLVSRTEGACSVILQENPEIVFLQEIVSTSLQILRDRLNTYDLFLGIEECNLRPKSYFTAILLRKDCSSVDSVNLAKFPTTLMSRTLLEVQCQVKSVPLALLTSHLESTAECSSERKKQLAMAFSRMRAITGDRTVLFGGDLNLRDKELTGASAVPENVVDVWEATGERQQARYTWDLTINDNKQLDMNFQPRCRFDRIYFRNSIPCRMDPRYFELVGIQRLTSCRRFPSDHWGILSHFEKRRVLSL